MNLRGIIEDISEGVITEVPGRTSRKLSRTLFKITRELIEIYIGMLPQNSCRNYSDDSYTDLYNDFSRTEKRNVWQKKRKTSYKEGVASTIYPNW